MLPCALWNRSPTRSLEGKTPYEEWSRKKPSVGHLRIFGCVAYVKRLGGHLKKLDDRSEAMVFVGYEVGSKAYRFYDPSTQKIHVSRDASFEEKKRRWTTDTEETEAKSRFFTT